MAVNEEHRQVEVARDLSSQARTLAHSTRDVPAPFDSYTLLGELVATVDDLQQVCQQLGLWHSRVVDGEHYAGEDNRGDGRQEPSPPPLSLQRAAAALGIASEALRAAHSANGVVRWFDE